MGTLTAPNPNFDILAIQTDSINTISDSLKKVFWALHYMLTDVVADPPPGSWKKFYEFDIGNVMLIDLEHPMPIYPTTYSRYPMAETQKIFSAWDLKPIYQEIVDLCLRYNEFGIYEKKLFFMFQGDSENGFDINFTDELVREPLNQVDPNLGDTIYMQNYLVYPRGPYVTTNNADCGGLSCPLKWLFKCASTVPGGKPWSCN
jgi:hypothetical protein